MSNPATPNTSATPVSSKGWTWKNTSTWIIYGFIGLAVVIAVWILAVKFTGEDENSSKEKEAIASSTTSEEKKVEKEVVEKDVTGLGIGESTEITIEPGQTVVVTTKKDSESKNHWEIIKGAAIGKNPLTGLTMDFIHPADIGDGDVIEIENKGRGQAIVSFKKLKR